MLKNKQQDKPEGARRGVARRLVAGAALTAALCLAAPLAAADGPASATIEDTRASLAQWVEVQRVISAEKRDFVLAKEVLNERATLLEREIESLRAKIQETEASIAEADRKREELVATNEKLTSSSAGLSRSVVPLEKGVAALLTRLPDPVREMVKPLSQRIPENADESKLSLAERFQNVVGILNEVNKFNGEIRVASELRSLPEGDSAEVTAVYLGVGQGFYSGAGGTIAGVGASTGDAWLWKPANEAADSVAQVIAILKNEKVATYIQVPVSVQE
jgi:FtsZ-binding cell division protein ZapB